MKGCAAHLVPALAVAAALAAGCQTGTTRAQRLPVAMETFQWLVDFSQRDLEQVEAAVARMPQGAARDSFAARAQSLRARVRSTSAEIAHASACPDEVKDLTGLQASVTSLGEDISQLQVEVECHSS